MSALLSRCISHTDLWLLLAVVVARHTSNHMLVTERLPPNRMVLENKCAIWWELKMARCTKLLPERNDQLYEAFAKPYDLSRLACVISMAFKMDSIHSQSPTQSLSAYPCSD